MDDFDGVPVSFYSYMIFGSRTGIWRTKNGAHVGNFIGNGNVSSILILTWWQVDIHADSALFFSLPKSLYFVIGFETISSTLLLKSQ